MASGKLGILNSSPFDLTWLPVWAVLLGLQSVFLDLHYSESKYTLV